jgi:hypothetical protein
VEVREYDVRKPFGAIIIYPADHHTVDTILLLYRNISPFLYFYDKSLGLIYISNKIYSLLIALILVAGWREVGWLLVRNSGVSDGRFHGRRPSQLLHSSSRFDNLL